MDLRASVPMPGDTGTDVVVGTNRVSKSIVVEITENATVYSGSFVPTAVEVGFFCKVDPTHGVLPVYPSSSLYAAALVEIGPRIFGSLNLVAKPVKLGVV